MPWIATELIDGQKGIDRLDAPNTTQFEDLYNDGYTFYIGYTQTMTADDMSNAAYTGQSVMLVQGYYTNMAESASASSRASEAVQQAKAITYPTGTNLWLDWESQLGVSASKSESWCNEWASTVSASGYIPGLYVGPDQNMTATDLGNLHFNHYWRSASTVPDVSGRGYQMTQGDQESFSYITNVDPDTVKTDNDGGLPYAAFWTNR